jgi:hypothetical protein
MYRPTFRLAGIAALAVALAGCATMQVNSYTERGLDLRSYRTYNWAPADQAPTGDPRLDNNQFFQERVRMAVENRLATRGLAKTAMPDLLVHYHASVVQDIHTSSFAPGDRSCEDCGPEVYDAGTLLIDLVDARTNRLLWRGWAKGSIEGVIDDQDWLEQRIDEAVARIFRELPPVL